MRPRQSGPGVQGRVGSACSSVRHTVMEPHQPKAVAMLMAGASGQGRPASCLRCAPAAGRRSGAGADAGAHRVRVAADGGCHVACLGQGVQDVPEVPQHPRWGRCGRVQGHVRHDQRALPTPGRLHPRARRDSAPASASTLAAGPPCRGRLSAAQRARTPVLPPWRPSPGAMDRQQA